MNDCKGCPYCHATKTLFDVCTFPDAVAVEGKDYVLTAAITLHCLNPKRRNC